jgi:hypothetical protein
MVYKRYINSTGCLNTVLNYDIKIYFTAIWLNTWVASGFIVGGLWAPSCWHTITTMYLDKLNNVYRRAHLIIYFATSCIRTAGYSLLTVHRTAAACEHDTAARWHPSECLIRRRTSTQWLQLKTLSPVERIPNAAYAYLVSLPVQCCMINHV